MISHDHRCIFIHIPKCAGTSIERVLGHLDEHKGRDGQDHRTVRMIERPYPTMDVLRSVDNMEQALRRERHHRFVKLANPKNGVQASTSQYREYFKFTIVRNPWARAFSWYKNVVRDDLHQARHHYRSGETFSDYMKENAGKGMLRPQMHWIKNFRGENPLDFVGRFERLYDDVAFAMEKIGFSNWTLPHAIKGDGDDYRIHYTTEIIDLVQEVYREEIDLFGYHFE